MRLPLCLWVVAALAFVACGAGIDSSEDKLKNAVEQLNEGMRWGRLDDVIQNIEPASQEQFLQMHKEFGNRILITGYEVVSSKVDLKKQVADIGIKIVWYRVDEMEVKETTLLQRWEERDRNWLLVAEEFRGGTPF